MTSPTLSVLLPVYNAELYLRQAIDSVLSQTFTDFELLLLNDGSTDGSEKIIENYKDPRIHYIKNERNMGLIATLNKGLQLARGKYIARMDSDDVCHPERFQKQVQLLETSDTDVVASTVQMMDAGGHPLAAWNADLAHLTPTSIQSFLPKDNCIAHPSVMGRASILQSYAYQTNQTEAEDYDLWLRLVADGKKICKIQEPLLHYRFLQTGLTRKEKQSAAERLFRTKKKFLQQRWKEKKINAFVMKVAFYAGMDLMKATVKKLFS